MNRAAAERAEALLAALPDDPAAIAEFFRSSGVTGRRRISCECPVSRYLGRQTGAQWYVYPQTGAWEAAAMRAPDLPVFLAVPKAVQFFAQSFDDGLYPYLDEEA